MKNQHFVCMVYIARREFAGFHFLISLLKAYTVSNCFSSLGTIFHILGPRKEMLSVPLKTLRTFGLANSKGFRMS